MTLLRLLSVGLCWLAVTGSAAAGAAAVESEASAHFSSKPQVVVLSWDGVRHDYPDRSTLPALSRIAREGVRAGRLIPVFPSNTFPGHVSLATGTYPDRHGIVDNHFVDVEKGRYRMSAEADWLQAEPLWIAAERQGVPTATYFWVGSESDWRGQGTRYRMTPFDGSRPEADKVDQILAWLAMPADERPRLIMSYWRGGDSSGHRYGADSSQVRADMESQDRQLQRLLDGLDRMGLWNNTTLIVVSDHGMTDTGDYLDLRGALADAAIGARVTGSTVAQIYLDDPADLEAAMAAVAPLQPATAYRKADLPEALRLRHPTRTGDLVVAAEPPYTFSRPAGVEGRIMSAMYAMGKRFGGHGYDPRHPDMGGIFFAMGRGVPDTLELPEIHQVDVAATVARLLNIDPPRDSEGRTIRGIGEHLISEEAPGSDADR